VVKKILQNTCAMCPPEHGTGLAARPLVQIRNSRAAAMKRGACIFFLELKAIFAGLSAEEVQA
jgi:hypothetical protein